MYVALFCLIGIVALAATVRNNRHTLSDGEAEQIASAGRQIEQLELRLAAQLESRRFDPRMAAHVRVRIASLMARDPVYTEVVRAIRKACAAQTSISEMALCVGLRQFLIEDIRISMEIAEMLGQVRRAEEGGSPTVMAEFHPTA